MNNSNYLLSLKDHFKKFLCCFLIGMAFTTNALGDNKLKLAPFKEEALQVAVSIHINNIYSINTVDETYQLDGYIVYRWKDERMKFTPDSIRKEPKVYINDCAKELILEKLWIPKCEFINVQGEEECPNMRIEISSDGGILFTERFFGTFITNMNFEKFPFDSQSFKIIVEPWGFNKEQVMLVSPQLFPEWSSDLQIIDKWEVDSMGTIITEKVYDHLGIQNENSRTWSRVEFEVKATRLSGYFVWQILFPLIIIIVASFVMFWIRDFGTQIGVGFSLMLTVVAFNFYSASILPKLPYNTFIEYIILVGYIFIFLGIIAIIINYRLNGDSREENKYPLLKWFRYLFPLIYLLVMVGWSVIFLS